MSGIEGWIARQRRRLSLGVFLSVLADGLALFLLLFGTAVLIVKLARPGWWPWVLWLAAGAVPLAAWAWVRSGRRGFSRGQAVALLDSRLGAGGLLMTLSETSDERWFERLSLADAKVRLALPRVRPVRAARRLALPILFAVGACFAPLRIARTETFRPNVVGNEATESLTETLQLLQQNEVLDRKEAEELGEAIKNLQAQTKDAPLTHESWETVDAIRDRMSVRAEDAQMAATQARDALESLASDAARPGGELTSDRREKLEQDAAEALRKLSKGGNFAHASPALQKQLKELLKNRRLTLPKDPQAREKMLSDLRKFLDKESKKLAECRCRCKGGQCDRDGDGFNDDPTKPHGKRPGRGGVDRGRGDAELTWGDESDAHGSKFKEIVLPPGAPDQPNKEVIAESASAPQVEPASSAPRGAAREAGPATGHETWNRNVRPRHRAAVRSYFESSR